MDNQQTTSKAEKVVNKLINKLAISELNLANLEVEIDDLKQEKQQLIQNNQQLTAEKQQLAQNNKQLTDENEKLAAENQQLKSKQETKAEE